VSVLCEGLSVIVTRTCLEVSYPGGVDGYERDCPNDTYCADEHLTRIGFMHPNDVGAFLNQLASLTGLTLEERGRWLNAAVVDQFTGPTGACDWLDFSREAGITRAWLSHQAPGQLACPLGWRGPNPMRLHTFAEAEGMVFGTEDLGVQSTIYPETGEVAYTGRTYPTVDPDAVYLDRFRAAEREADWPSALERAREWTQSRSDCSRAWYLRGVAAINIKNKEEAARCFERCCELSPEYEPALANLGGVRLDLLQSDLAEEPLTEALRLDPQDPVVLYHVGRLMLERDQDQTALRYFDRAARCAAARDDYDLEKIARSRHDQVAAMLKSPEAYDTPIVPQRAGGPLPLAPPKGSDWLGVPVAIGAASFYAYLAVTGGSWLSSQTVAIVGLAVCVAGVFISTRTPRFLGIVSSMVSWAALVSGAVLTLRHQYMTGALTFMHSMVWFWLTWKAYKAIHRLR
jgi:hypothetical protein